jgi:hypothetical protein
MGAVKGLAHIKADEPTSTVAPARALVRPAIRAEMLVEMILHRFLTSSRVRKSNATLTTLSGQAIV